MLETVQGAQVRRHPIPKAHGEVVTPLIWRAREESAALLALKQALIAPGTAGAPPPGRPAEPVPRTRRR